MTKLEATQLKNYSKESLELIIWQAKRDGDTFAINEALKALALK